MKFNLTWLSHAEPITH